VLLREITIQRLELDVSRDTENGNDQTDQPKSSYLEQVCRNLENSLDGGMLDEADNALAGVDRGLLHPCFCICSICERGIALARLCSLSEGVEQIRRQRQKRVVVDPLKRQKITHFEHLGLVRIVSEGVLGQRHGWLRSASWM